jgi:hypothetical protein
MVGRAKRVQQHAASGGHVAGLRHFYGRGNLVPAIITMPYLKTL